VWRPRSNGQQKPTPLRRYRTTWAHLSAVYGTDALMVSRAEGALQRFPAEVLVEEMDDEFVGILGVPGYGFCCWWRSSRGRSYAGE
jgi:polyisoprenoid-binding protein YceI